MATAVEYGLIAALIAVVTVTAINQIDEHNHSEAGTKMAMALPTEKKEDLALRWAVSFEAFVQYKDALKAACTQNGKVNQDCVTAAGKAAEKTAKENLSGGD